MAKLQSKVKDDERSEGVLKMAVSTKVLAMMDVIINGAFRTLFMMNIDLEREMSPEFEL